MTTLVVRRRQRVPDALRVARCLRAPEVGPRVLFFSGGSALRGISQVLIEYTHNSIHLITPFDSGGSSAKLRDAFPMISVGDLRNRLMALADTRLHGHPAVYALFSHRLPSGDPTVTRARLSAELDAMVRGDHALVAPIPAPLRTLICRHLGYFVERMPSDFDLEGASIGNLILAGGYLNNECDIDAVIFLFSRLVEVRGLVRPTVDANLHLAVSLADGRVIVGQHRVTAASPPLPEPIHELHLSASLDEDRPAHAEIDARTRALVASADLIVFPIGSFFSSVLANLLPAGVGASIHAAGCPKVYLPNPSHDPEAAGQSVATNVHRLVQTLRADAGAGVAVSDLLDFVLVDRARGEYPGGLDAAEIERLGVVVVDVPLISDASAPWLDARLVVEALMSMA